MQEIRLLTPKQVTERYSIPQSTLYRWIANGDFPKPIKIGPRRTAFDVKTIEEFIEERRTTDNLEDPTK